MAPRLRLGDSQVLPKPALLVRAGDGALHVRALSTDQWHPGLALTGLVAVATLVAGAAPADVNLTVGHPGGTSTVRLRTRPDGRRTALVTGRRVTRLASHG